MFSLLEEERSSLDGSLIGITGCKFDWRMEHIPIAQDSDKPMLQASEQPSCQPSKEVMNKVCSIDAKLMNLDARYSRA